METPRVRSLSLALIALRIADAALSQRSCSVFPGGFAHSLNCASQSRDIGTLSHFRVHYSEASHQPREVRASAAWPCWASGNACSSPCSFQFFFNLLHPLTEAPAGYEPATSSGEDNRPAGVTPRLVNIRTV